MLHQAEDSHEISSLIFSQQPVDVSFQQQHMWKKFQGAETSSLFPPPFFQDMWPCVQLVCAENAMLHASETWPLTKPSLQHLQPNDRAMIRQICNVKPQDTANIRSTELLARRGIEDLDLKLKERRLRWYGHMECSNGAVKTAFDIQVLESVDL